MKNKFILGLILGIFLIGLVSASITGYLVSRGGGISDAGYTATLKKVEGTTAIVSVQTPTGDTELVRVAEGETAKVGDVEISASSLTRGTLFTRGGANVEIDVPKSASSVAKIATGTGAVTGHTHLTDYRHGTGKLFMAGIGLVQGIISCKTEFGNDYVVLGGGFQLTDALERGILINGPDIDERYRVSLNVNATNYTLPNYGKIYATCARIEPTLHQFGQDY